MHISMHLGFGIWETESGVIFSSVRFTFSALYFSGLVQSGGSAKWVRCRSGDLLRGVDKHFVNLRLQKFKS